MPNQGSVLFSFLTSALIGLLPKSDFVPIESVPGLRNHGHRDTQMPWWRRGSHLWVWTQQDKPYLAFPLLHRQHQVVLDLFLAVLAGAVKVILLLQLLPPLLAHVEEIHVGYSQLVPWRNLAQCPQFDPGCKREEMWTWRSSQSKGATTELSGTTW